MSFWSFSLPFTPSHLGSSSSSVSTCLFSGLHLRNDIGSYCGTLLRNDCVVTWSLCRHSAPLSSCKLSLWISRRGRSNSFMLPFPMLCQGSASASAFALPSVQVVLFADSGLSLRSYRARESSNSWSRRRDVWPASKDDGPPNRGIGKELARRSRARRVFPLPAGTV